MRCECVIKKSPKGLCSLASWKFNLKYVHSLIGFIDYIDEILNQESYSNTVMAERMIKKTRSIFQYAGIASHAGRNMIFQISNNGFLENGRVLLKERVSLFHGKTNHILCLSVNDLNTHFTDWIPYGESWDMFQHQCVWERRPVLVRFCKYDQLSHTNLIVEECCREIAIVTEMGMGIHKNVHKLLACCLETELPVLIYEYAGNGPLANRIYEEKNQLEWANRLRIAYEISHALAYLHTAFPRPIIHTDLKSENVMLDENDAAKLTGFNLCVSIPKGKTSVKKHLIRGTIGYIAPEYLCSGKLVEKSDVYSFGVLFLELLTGRMSRNWIPSMYDANNVYVLNDTLVRKLISENSNNLIDPCLAAVHTTNAELLHKQVCESTELGLRCITAEEESRPTMEEVATQLKNIIKSRESIIPSTSTGTTQ